MRALNGNHHELARRGITAGDSIVPDGLFAFRPPDVGCAFPPAISTEHLYQFDSVVYVEPSQGGFGLMMRSHLVNRKSTSLRQPATRERGPVPANGSGGKFGINRQGLDSRWNESSASLA